MPVQTSLPPLTEVLYIGKQVSVLEINRGYILGVSDGSLIVVSDELAFRRWAEGPMALNHLETARGTTRLDIKTLPGPIQQYWRRTVEQAQKSGRKIEVE